MSRLAFFLLALLSSSAALADSPTQTQSDNRVPTYYVERVLRHGCAAGGLVPLTEQATTRKLNALTMSGATIVDIQQPPTNITLGSIVVGSMTSGVWCPAGYVTVVYTR